MKKTIYTVFAVMMVFVLALGFSLWSGQAKPLDAPDSLGPGPIMIIREKPSDGSPPVHIPPPSAFLRAKAPHTATLQVIYNGTWDPAAQASFEYAKGIWESQITSAVPIVLSVSWEDMGSTSGILGGARAANFMRNFTNRPVADTWYAIALANKLAGTDLDPTNPDIIASFNVSYPNWYFGVDGNTPANKIDFVSVVLHEVGHGLGFSGSMSAAQSVCGASGVGCWGFGTPYPFAYDRFMVNGSGQALLDTNLFPNNSAALAAQLTSQNLFFAGPQTVQAYGGNRPKMYAPSTWQQGSSYSHFDDATFPVSSGNALMTPSIAPGEAIHSPGPLALAVFRDIGWTTGPAQPTPTYTASAPTPTRTPSSTYMPPGKWPQFLPLTHREAPYKPPSPGPTSTPTVSGTPPTPTRTATGATPTRTATATTQVPQSGIVGQVTYHGAAAPGIHLLLRFWDGAAWSTAATATTDASGNYRFTGLPALASGQTYYVRYNNGSDGNANSSNYLWRWMASYITTYTGGSQVAGGSFDIANVTHALPAQGATITLPTVFSWNRRSVANDNYYLVFYYPAYDVSEQTNLLGDVGQTTITGLPTGWASGDAYQWSINVQQGSQSGAGYGMSYYYRDVTINYAMDGAASDGTWQPRQTGPADPFPGEFPPGMPER